MTTLLSDLFGIQARAGCACAGPYAHTLLGIDDARTQAYRARRVLDREWAGLRPGWSRVSLHWAMDEAEIDYVIRAIAFIAEEGVEIPRPLPVRSCNRRVELARGYPCGCARSDLRRMQRGSRGALCCPAG